MDKMKIRNLLFIACLASISFVVLANAPVVARASGRHYASTVEELQKKPPVYKMVKRSIVGTNDIPGEQVWDVQVATMITPQVNVNPQPPGYLFKSLDSPPLLNWVSSLPPYSNIELYNPTEYASGKPQAKRQEEFRTFVQFCSKHNVYVDVTLN